MHSQYVQLIIILLIHPNWDLSQLSILCIGYNMRWCKDSFLLVGALNVLYPDFMNPREGALVSVLLFVYRPYNLYPDFINPNRVPWL
jgi:hypothetical protein